MKRFIISILCVAVFFVGLGAIVDNAGAKFRSDDKALALIKQARQAIGGDQAISGIRSMTIVGKTTRTIKTNTGENIYVGETEVAMQLPNKLMKIVKSGSNNEAGREALKEFDVVVTRGDKSTGEVITEDIRGGVEKIVIKNSDGTVEEINGDGPHKITVRQADGKDLPNENAGSGDEKRVIVRHDKIGEHGAVRQNELLRTTLALLLSAPDGMDVTYTFGGETEIDGTSCNLVNADFGGATIKLFLSKASSLPVMMSYSDHSMPMIFKMRTKTANGAEPTGDIMTFKRSPDGAANANVEHQIRFADYRITGGVQLPYKWRTTATGGITEVFDVNAYDINPANIAEKFANQKVRVKKVKDGQ